MRIGLRRCLWLVVLASVFCTAVRSAVDGDVPGLLTWPVLLGFGVHRAAAGNGVAGATVGGLFGFGLVAYQGWTSPGLSVSVGNIPMCLLLLSAGACWGFYVGVWAYIIVESICQSI